jgi:bloom syndrome protein
MALTATATPLVARHIIETLQMTGCEQVCDHICSLQRCDSIELQFKQSFNRTNLYYEVRRKGARNSTIKDMVSFINNNFHNESGIVYCLSKYDVRLFFSC